MSGSSWRLTRYSECYPRGLRCKLCLCRNAEMGHLLVKSNVPTLEVLRCSAQAMHEFVITRAEPDIFASFYNLA